MKNSNRVNTLLLYEEDTAKRSLLSGRQGHHTVAHNVCLLFESLNFALLNGTFRNVASDMCISVICMKINITCLDPSPSKWVVKECLGFCGIKVSSVSQHISVFVLKQVHDLFNFLFTMLLAVSRTI